MNSPTFNIYIPSYKRAKTACTHKILEYYTYDWKNIYVNDVLVRQEYVEQAVKRGTADNPITWASGMALIQNAYYVHNGETKVWMGEAGVKGGWTAAAFVPI